MVPLFPLISLRDRRYLFQVFIVLIHPFE